MRMARFCKKCGNEIAEGIKFCAKCGTPTDETWVCAACGHENKNGNFCAKCGGGKNGAVAALFPPQGAAFPGAGQRANPSFSLPGGKWAKLLPVFVVLAVAVYFTVGKFMVYRYDAKCGEIVAAMRESKELLVSMKELSGDPEEDGAKQFAEGLAKNAEKLEKQTAEFANMTAPEERNDKHNEFLSAMNRHKEFIKKLNEVLPRLMELRLWTRREQDSSDAFKKSLGDLKSAWDATVSTDMPLVAPNGDALLDTAFYKSVMDETFVAYLDKRKEFDKAYLNEKLKEYHAQRDADNEKLKAKKEVVFLRTGVVNEGSDLIIKGRFYNGTEDMVSGIKDMLVDIRCLQFDKEMLAIKDEPITVGLSGIWLAPGNSTNVMEIRLPGKAPKEYCNHFENNMHKIRWGVRRAIQR